MHRQLVAASIAMALVSGMWVATPLAQIPRETSVYELVDVGPVPSPGTCACIASPFTIPYVPSPKYGSGAAAPLGSPPLTAAEYEKAAAAYKVERATIGNVAEEGFAGNPNASLSVAMHLSVEAAIAGEHPRTEEETVRWLFLAAQQNHHDAFRLLGYRYLRGRGVPHDPATAAYWFRQGARRDDPISMTALGLLFAAGRGVRQDWSEAVALWERAESRQPLAARFAGDAYASGLGTPQDHARAAALYKRAADMELSASIQLGHMYANRCAEGGDEAAVKAFERAADQGFPDAQIVLSHLLREGRGTDPNPYMAYTLARIAELRLPDGDMKTRASAAVASAKRLMRPEAIPSQEALVQDMVTRARTPIR